MFVFHLGFDEAHLEIGGRAGIAATANLLARVGGRRCLLTPTALGGLERVGESLLSAGKAMLGSCCGIVLLPLAHWEILSADSFSSCNLLGRLQGVRAGADEPCLCVQPEGGTSMVLEKSCWCPGELS